MKIVNIHYTGFGGLASVVHGMVTAKGAEEHEWVMAYYGVAPLDPAHEAFCQTHGITYETFNPRLGKPWRAWLALSRWVVKLQPDVILCHSLTTIPAFSWYAKLQNIPLIAIEHTPNEVKSRNEWAGSRAAMLFADRVVVLTNTYEELLRSKLGWWFRQKKIRIIHNGIDTSKYSLCENKSSSLNKRMAAGMAARLSQSKRHDLLIDISTDIPLDIRLAGEGENLQSLKQQVKDSDCTNVKFCGLVPPESMAEWLRGIDIYLHASSGETFSMSILQAMASGLPIIASDISGMDELLGRDGSCGILVPNQRSAWISAIRKLLNSNELRLQIGRNARLRAMDRFSSEAMLKGYIQVINEVADKRQNSNFKK